MSVLTRCGTHGLKTGAFCNECGARLDVDPTGGRSASAIREIAAQVLRAPEPPVSFPTGDGPGVVGMTKWIRDPEAATLARFALHVTSPEMHQRIADTLTANLGRPTARVTDAIMTLLTAEPAGPR